MQHFKFLMSFQILTIYLFVFQVRHYKFFSSEVVYIYYHHNDREPKFNVYACVYEGLVLIRLCNNLNQHEELFLTIMCVVSMLGVSPNFEITVACGLKSHWYLRTFSLAETANRAETGKLQFWSQPSEILNLKSSNTPETIDFTPPCAKIYFFLNPESANLYVT